MIKKRNPTKYRLKAYFIEEVGLPLKLLRGFSALIWMFNYPWRQYEPSPKPYKLFVARSPLVVPTSTSRHQNIRGAFPLQFEYQLWGKHWPSPNPYKKNRVSFSIPRQIVRNPFSSAGTDIKQMKKRNLERLERWAKEISLTSLTICLFSLIKQAQTCTLCGIACNYLIWMCSRHQ